MTILEVCIETADDVIAARRGGADRLEVCSALDLGGLTPSNALMQRSLEEGLECRALIRPRGGSFLYNNEELEVISNDIRHAKAVGIHGVVVGVTTPDYRLDRDALARLADSAATMGLTLHRAFDITPDPFESLEIAIDLGFDRILTSGQQPSAADGVPLLTALVKAARGRITILAGGGITPGNAGHLIESTSVPEVHASCRRSENAEPVVTRFTKFGFGFAPRGVDEAVVSRLIAAIRVAHPPDV